MGESAGRGSVGWVVAVGDMQQLTCDSVSLMPDLFSAVTLVYFNKSLRKSKIKIA